MREPAVLHPHGVPNLTNARVQRLRKTDRFGRGTASRGATAERKPMEESESVHVSNES